MENRKIIETVRTIETIKTMRTIDLHIHTTSSNGTSTPTKIVQEAKDKGLSAIAITDHNCMSGVEEAIAEGKRLHIEVIPGIEISTEFCIPDSNDPPIDVHLLGLFVDFHDVDFHNSDIVPKLEQRREAIKKRNIERIEKVLHAKVYESKYELSYDNIVSQTKTEAFGKYAIRQYLVSKGMNDSDAQALFLKGGAAYVESINTPNFEDDIRLIHQAGGLAVLAHPIAYLVSFMELEKMIKSMKKVGLDGIETYHSDNTPYTSQCIAVLADKCGLCKSGGSDYHGRNYNFELGTCIEGNFCVPYSILDDLRKDKSKK